MKDINQFICTGRLTRDAELTYNNAGTAFCNFSVAYSRSIKKNDQWEDKSCFIEAVLFGKRGESLNQYLNKGQQITITGELDFERWEKDGQKRSKYKLIVGDLRLMGGNKSESSYTPTETGTDDNNGGGSLEEDIPF